MTNTSAKLALGTWAWGDTPDGQVFGNHLTTADLRPVVQTAMAAGFTLWDTAYAYGAGASEDKLGELLQDYPRDDYQLSTKFTPQMAAGDSDHEVADMLAGSLQRLHTDYIDIYWIHNPADVEKWTPQLIPLVQSGKIKRIGVSNHNLEQIKRADEILGEAGLHISAVQNHFSLLYRSSEKAGIIDYCKQHGLTFFGYMVLEQGLLTGRYNVDNPLPAGSMRANIYNAVLPQVAALTAGLTAIGEKQGASAAEVATAYALAKGVTPIVGVTKAKYMASETKALSLKLSATDISRLEELAAAANVNTKGSWEAPMA
ncbi:aldo/keto reductase [Levilactobacillus tujiorum]|uniref:Aldo/keto reductase n=1 Tax=Levilactobacillus tujiorum TaxID=2912243 RepID=A0ABX1L620_9LACO|nr:aldo/keto reductase [Levilactobacillus tujiorum]MCH5465500.1 aldo/keto reductase [Levilactobacillus tujiorum]NLR12586.1 aldo/keto reductase [Lactobacillus sp. HBUAS51387]NLR29789.1 aldo/keto reductase [Levilactobacillus tujiorum]